MSTKDDRDDEMRDMSCLVMLTSRYGVVIIQQFYESERERGREKERGRERENTKYKRICCSQKC